MINEFVLGIAIILLTGLLFGKLAKKLRIPNVTGYLVGGLVIGPALAGSIAHFSGVIGWDMVTMLDLIVDIELGFIAFTVGSEFKMSYFKQVGPMPVIVAFAESFGAVLFVTVGVTVLGLALGAPLYFALCLGAVSGATAPAATIMVLRQYRARGQFTQTLLSVVAVDDASSLIYFGVSIAIVKNLVGGGSDVFSIIWPIIEILGSCALGIITGFLLTYLIKAFKSNGNRLVLVIAMIFVNIGICILIKDKTGYSFSSLLACMATGAIFTNKSDKVEAVVPLVEGITPPLVIIFFVISGASLEFSAIKWQAIVILIAYIILRVAGKVVGALVSAKACKVPKHIRNKLGFGLLPQGGIDIGLAILIKTVLDANLPGSEYAGTIYNGEMLKMIVLCAVLISGVFGPIMCKYALSKTGDIPCSSDKNPVAEAGSEAGDAGDLAASEAAATSSGSDD